MNGGIDVKRFMADVVLRGLGGLVSGIWLPSNLKSPQKFFANGRHTGSACNIFSQSWLRLAQPDVWVGVLVGAAMIVVAMRVRRWRAEG